MTVSLSGIQDNTKDILYVLGGEDKAWVREDLSCLLLWYYAWPLYLILDCQADI